MGEKKTSTLINISWKVVIHRIDLGKYKCIPSRFLFLPNPRDCLLSAHLMPSPFQGQARKC